MVWQMAGIVFTTLVIALVFLLDRRVDAAVGRGADAPDADGRTAGTPPGRR
jgi:hypothetical protein